MTMIRQLFARVELGSSSLRVASFAVALTAVIGCSFSASAYEIEGSLLAASPAKPSSSTSGGTPKLLYGLEFARELKRLENRFFFHAYDHDPPEKRLERLELLILGSAQYGVNEERLAGIKSAVEKRDRESADMVKGRNASAEPKPGTKTEAESGSLNDDGALGDYPILTTLEWRVLKKTYRAETIDSRLERLEEKLLGKASPAMSYADRIDRLKKIAGVLTPGSVAEAPIPSGPDPRAGGSAQERDGSRSFRMSPFGGFGGSMLPPGAPRPDSTFQEDLRMRSQKDMAQMLRFMDKAFSGMFQGMPRTPLVIPGNPGSPYSSPYPFSGPNSDQEKRKPQIPPYADPNSI